MAELNDGTFIKHR